MGIAAIGVLPGCAMPAHARRASKSASCKAESLEFRNPGRSNYCRCMSRRRSLPARIPWAGTPSSSTGWMATAAAFIHGTSCGGIVSARTAGWNVPFRIKRACRTHGAARCFLYERGMLQARRSRCRGRVGSPADLCRRSRSCRPRRRSPARGTYRLLGRGRRESTRSRR